MGSLNPMWVGGLKMGACPFRGVGMKEFGVMGKVVDPGIYGG